MGTSNSDENGVMKMEDSGECDGDDVYMMKSVGTALVMHLLILSWLILLQQFLPGKVLEKFLLVLPIHLHLRASRKIAEK